MLKGSESMKPRYDIINTLFTKVVVYRKRCQYLYDRIPEYLPNYNDYKHQWEREFARTEKFMESLLRGMIKHDMVNKEFFIILNMFEKINHQMNYLDRRIKEIEVYKQEMHLTQFENCIKIIGNDQVHGGDEIDTD